MECPKCKTQNSDLEQFCRRCHMTLRYKCPSCGSAQRHGGKCDACGVDFAKFATMLIAQEQSRVDRQHEKIRGKASACKQLLLLPITGGFSLVRRLLRRDGWLTGRDA